MPFARRMRPLPLSQIRITDKFWARWQQVVVEKGLPGQFEMLEETDRLGNLRREATKEMGSQTGLYFNDSDVYKWLEACGYALSIRDNPKLREQAEEAIKVVLAAQEPDGYINSFITLNHPTLRWRNLSAMHEMYCGGHLIEAGVAHFENLGDRRLLDTGIRFADLVLATFGPDAKRGYCGHEEIELAFVRLSAATGDPKYRERARWMMEERGKRPTVFQQEMHDKEAMTLSPWVTKKDIDGPYVGDYAQDHAPIREHTEVVGHAVRAMYFYAAAADLADGQEDLDLEKALERIWSNLTEKRMYITGGIGPSRHNEGFTADYDLPNTSAYAETCAACGLVFWGQRMLEMTGSSVYADVIERALYNGAISGMSVSGAEYFYDNPLESRGGHKRTPWFTCACCPPNIARLICNLATYAVGVSDDAFYIHQFVGFEASAVFAGVKTKIVVESAFPWQGVLNISIDPERPVKFSLHLRVPEWSDDLSTETEEDVEEAEYQNGYAVFRRSWKAGDKLTVDLGIEPQWIESNPRVVENLGRCALTRGPLVYCFESHDNEFSPQHFTADPTEEIEERWEDALEGLVSVTVPGMREAMGSVDELYTPLGTKEVLDDSAVFIPYYAWANRGPSDMQVWVRY